MKKYRLYLFIIFLFTFTSCGSFINDVGIKNYEVNVPNSDYNSYQKDFLQFIELTESGFPKINEVFHKKKREHLKLEILEKLANGDKFDLYLQIRRYASQFDNSHTQIYPNFKWKTIYPFSVLNVKDNWQIMSTSKPYRESVGREIISINAISIDTIEHRLMDYAFGENLVSKKYNIRADFLMSNPYVLKEIGVIRTVNDSIKLKLNDKTLTLNIEEVDQVDLGHDEFEAMPITAYNGEPYAYEIIKNMRCAYFQYNGCHDQIDLFSGIETYVKPWLRPFARLYVRLQIKRKKTPNRIQRFYKPEFPVFKDFLWNMVDSLNSNKVSHLVLDLRNNSGGNFELCKQLLYFLTDDPIKGNKKLIYNSPITQHYFPHEIRNLEDSYQDELPNNELIEVKEEFLKNITDSTSSYYVPKNRPIFNGNIIVLANYRTFSAAASLAAILQDNHLATVIGTNTGTNPTGPTTFTPFKLNHSGMKGSLATSYHIRAKEEKGKLLEPEKKVEYSVKDFRRGYDPYWITAAELMLLNRK